MLIDVTNDVKIDMTYTFNTKGTELISLDDIIIIGEIITKNGYHNISLDVNGVMVLPCSLTLKPVNYLFQIEIEEEILVNSTNTIDIFPIVWENILMEIPIKVVSSDLTDVVTSGEGWNLIID